MIIINLIFYGFLSFCIIYTLMSLIGFWIIYKKKKRIDKINQLIKSKQVIETNQRDIH